MYVHVDRYIIMPKSHSQDHVKVYLRYVMLKLY